MQTSAYIINKIVKIQHLQVSLLSLDEFDKLVSESVNQMLCIKS